MMNRFWAMILWLIVVLFLIALMAGCQESQLKKDVLQLQQAMTNVMQILIYNHNLNEEQEKRINKYFGQKQIRFLREVR